MFPGQYKMASDILPSLVHADGKRVAFEEINGIQANSMKYSYLIVFRKARLCGTCCSDREDSSSMK